MTLSARPLPCHHEATGRPGASPIVLARAQPRSVAEPRPAAWSAARHPKSCQETLKDRSGPRCVLLTVLLVAVSLLVIAARADADRRSGVGWCWTIATGGGLPPSPSEQISTSSACRRRPVRKAPPKCARSSTCSTGRSISSTSTLAGLTLALRHSGSQCDRRLRGRTGSDLGTMELPPRRKAGSVFPVARIVAGDFDGYIRSWAKAAADWGKPLMLRFAQEMNGNWYPWGAGVNGNAPGEYAKAYRHVHKIFTSVGATNVIWIWSPNVLYPGGASLSSVYPGNAYVNWIGVDGYNFGTSAYTRGAGALRTPSSFPRSKLSSDCFPPSRS